VRVSGEQEQIEIDSFMHEDGALTGTSPIGYDDCNIRAARVTGGRDNSDAVTTQLSPGKLKFPRMAREVCKSRLSHGDDYEE
jgi:hypothetical protein